MIAIIIWSMRILCWAGFIYFVYAAVKARSPKARTRNIILAVIFAGLIYVFTEVIIIAYAIR